MVARREADEVPEEFRRALVSLRAAQPRPEVTLDETPAPQRLAPYAVAMTADVVGASARDRRDDREDRDDDELATGRLVLLHDPAGHEAWAGSFRVVTYVRAELEPEIAADPLLPGVGWAWLTEALAEHGAGFTAASGTVTRVASESFGGIAAEPMSAQIEIRASWTPLDEAYDAHLLAWCDLLCTAAGLPPVPDGVTALPHRRPGTR
jgi:Protein of unknown function (DUF3000)